MNLELIFALFEIYLDVINIDDFKDWLKRIHGITNYSKIFEGYKFLIRLLLRGIIENMSFLDFPYIVEDDHFKRAMYVIDNYDEIPNTCSKIIFYKNILKRIKQIERSNEFTDVKKSLRSLDDFIIYLEEIFHNYTNIVDKNYIKDEIALINKRRQLRLLSDTDMSRPWLFDTLAYFKFNLNQEYSKRILTGYIYSLEYLWYKFIDNEDLAKKSVKLHLALEKKPRKRAKSDPIYYVEISPIWWQLSGISKDGIKTGKCYPKYNQHASKLNNLYSFKKSIKNNFELKKRIEVFLKNKNLTEPEYLKRDDLDSKIKQLDMNMLWYPAETIGYLYGSIFRSIDVFKFLLTGIAEKAIHDKIYENIVVALFRHPRKLGPNKVGHNISIGILIPSSYSFETKVGWLIFDRCATDYSDSGRDLLFAINKIVEEYSTIIKLNEFTVEYDVYSGYLELRSSTIGGFLSYKQLITKEDMDNKVIDLKNIQNSSKRKYQDWVDELRGKLFEFMVFKWLSESNQNNKNIKVISIINNEEIDIIIDNKQIELFECKINIGNNYKDTISQIQKKYKAIRINHPQKIIIKKLVVYGKIKENRIKEFNDNCIEVIDDFRKIISSNSIFHGTRKQIIQLLEDRIQIDKMKY